MRKRRDNKCNVKAGYGKGGDMGNKIPIRSSGDFQIRCIAINYHAVMNKNILVIKSDLFAISQYRALHLKGINNYSLQIATTIQPLKVIEEKA